MAQEVQVILVDDMDGGKADRTVTFSYDGVSYEIDLSERNAKKFADIVAPYVGGARRMGSTGRKGSKRRSGRGGSKASPADIREWARAEGFEVSERGRISGELTALYEAAHGSSR